MDAAVLSNLYSEYERQFRYFGLFDHATLLGMARFHIPGLPDETKKGECANIIMEHSRLGLRIAKLEKEQLQEKLRQEIQFAQNRLAVKQAYIPTLEINVDDLVLRQQYYDGIAEEEALIARLQTKLHETSSEAGS